MNYPRVGPADAKSFGKVWDSGGIKIILDDVHFKFATDFANIALRSFIDQQISIANAKMKALQVDAATQAPTQAPIMPATKPSGIVLTD